MLHIFSERENVDILYILCAANGWTHHIHDPANSKAVGTGLLHWPVGHWRHSPKPRNRAATRQPTFQFGNKTNISGFNC